MVLLDLDRIELQPGRLSAFLQINVGFGADVATRSFDEFGRLRCENVPHVPAFFRYPYPPTVQCLMTASVRTRPHASVVSSRGARAPVRSSRSRNSQYTIPSTNVAPASAPMVAASVLAVSRMMNLRLSAGRATRMTVLTWDGVVNLPPVVLQ